MGVDAVAKAAPRLVAGVYSENRVHRRAMPSAAWRGGAQPRARRVFLEWKADARGTHEAWRPEPPIGIGDPSFSAPEVRSTSLGHIDRKLFRSRSAFERQHGIPHLHQSVDVSLA